ncbi:MAG TPA: putative zinc-binding metallopeptidase, partial [Gammaproteobacteria bacterium]|nr:putative zinc-binding metallopeptidase [Gammaproteobacteria bacterium]
VLGHLRHEVGHYYWYLLVDGTPRVAAFRNLFGDERASYADAQRRHYDQGPPEDWQTSFVSAYASLHPWEDFAETWAHYIHIVDTLESAHASSLSLAGRPLDSPLPLSTERAFADVLDDWRPLAVCLNQLNRSMGLPDAYPFVLTDRVADKLAFVHNICLEATLGAGPQPQLGDAARASAASLH